MVRRIRRLARRSELRFREIRLFVRALASVRHPVLAQIVPIRRCNLSCAYCNEYDKHSAPVATGVMLQRIDRLAALGTTAIDLSGGEPLLHPELDGIVGRIRGHGIIAGLLTNGYLLSKTRIEQLNRAGLDRLQISIDNLLPNEVSHKSLKVLDRKLELLAAHADFGVNINTVLGEGVGDPADAVAIARRALSLGFHASVGLIHDGRGQRRALSERHRAAFDAIAALTRGFYSHAHDRVFQRTLARGAPNVWHCGAGGRYLYVCEDGLVHWCSQQRGHPAMPLDACTPADLERERLAEKSCAPYCTVSCVHRVALLDQLRERPPEAIGAIAAAHAASGGRVPASVRVLTWTFLSGPPARRMRQLAQRTLGSGPHTR